MASGAFERVDSTVEQPKASEPPRRASTSLRVGRWTWLCLLLAAAFALRVRDIDLNPWSPDENFSIELATGSWHELVARTAADVHPPLYYAILKLWFAIAPSTLWSAKFLSVIFSVATLWLLFLFARSYFSEAAAWAAVATGAISPYLVYWSHAARMHQLMPLAVMCVMLASIRFLASGGTRAFVAAACAWILTTQTNYMALIFALPWAAWVLLERTAPMRTRVRLLASLLPAGVLFVPWLPVLATQSRSWIINRGYFQDFLSPVSFYFQGLFGWMEAYQHPHTGWLYIVRLAVFAAVVYFAARALRGRWGYALLLLAVPALAIALVWLRGWTLAGRHLLFMQPLFLAFWGSGIVEILRIVRSRTAIQLGPRNSPAGTPD